MIMVNVVVGGSVALGNDPLDDLVPVELLRQALLVNLQRLEILARRGGVVEDALSSSPHRLDVVLDALEALEALEVFVRLPRVVNVRVVLPLDEETQVARRFVLLVLFVLDIALVVVDTIDGILATCAEPSALALDPRSNQPPDIPSNSPFSSDACPVPYSSSDSLKSQSTAASL